jgi:hypothetical protein
LIARNGVTVSVAGFSLLDDHLDVLIRFDTETALTWK